MGRNCSAIAKSTNEPCKKKPILGSRYCIFHIEKTPIIFSALIGVILGYIFIWILPSPELTELRELRDDVKPILSIAENSFPSVDRSKAIEELSDEIKVLREKVSENEFTPLNNDFRSSIIEMLTPVANNFSKENIRIDITHETWTNPPTREFTKELAKIFKDAGFNVKGPDYATIYLASPAFPVEWGFNKDQANLLNQLYAVVAKIIEPDKRHAARRTLEIGRIRIHFAGKAKFNTDGTVKIN